MSQFRVGDRTFPLTIAAIAMLAVPFGLSQENALPAHPNHPTSIVSAENRWRFSPLDLSIHPDTASASVRAQRTAAILPKLQERDSYAEENRAFTEPLPTWIIPDDEVAPFPGSLWVVAKFADYQVVPVELSVVHTKSDLWTYTDMEFSVRQVLAATKASDSALGEQFSVLAVGGEARIANESIVGPVPQRKEYYPIPGHTYLMNIYAEAVPGVYGFVPQSLWDVTSGNLVPDSVVGASMTAQGISRISGKTVNEANATIQQSFSGAAGR